uniref:Uncharacterized protein n=1 Tax=Tetradesmus obliquus TaxID=3088 RepID=A0A383W8L1_TETOB|eukprot:jgi/Sobl393_1/11685/SZX73540.1
MSNPGTSDSRHGSRSCERSNTSDSDSEHSSGSAAAGRKRRRSVSRGRGSAAAQNSKRGTRPAVGRAAAAVPLPAAAPPSRRGGLQVVELPGGIIRVGGMASSTLPPAVPRAFVTKCFPGLQQQNGQRQQVQLRVTVDAQPGADSSPAGDEATTATLRCSSHRSTIQFVLLGAAPLLRRFPHHTLTGMSGVRGSTQLTLHLQPPAAAAAAQQVAEAAAAAAEADPTRWQEHEEPDGISCFEVYNSGSPCLRFAVPPTLLASAFGGTWPRPGFKVQLSVHKDGDRIAGWHGEHEQRSLGGKYGGSNQQCANIPTAAMPLLSGCLLTKIRAAAPNFLQAHFTSQPCRNTAAVQPPAAAHSGSQPAAAAKPAVARWGLPVSSMQRRHNLLLQQRPPAASAAAAAAAAAAAISAGSGGSHQHYRLTGVNPLLRRYTGHTSTSMSGVNGSTQLTRHMQPPAAAADPAAAAAKATGASGEASCTTATVAAPAIPAAAAAASGSMEQELQQH